MPLLKKLYDEHSERVFKLAFTYVHNQEDAEEITQDVFLRIHREIDNFKGESQISTWIHRITVNLALDYIKKENRKKRQFTHSKNSTDALPHHTKSTLNADHLIRAQEFRALYRESISILSEDQKRAFLLSHELDLTTQEIAEIMGKSKSSIGSLKHRALEKLNQYLKSKINRDR